MYPKEWEDYFDEEEVKAVLKEVRKDIIDGINISPAYHNIFSAFSYVTPDDVKVVILGQDPYPDPRHSHGLAFSSRAIAQAMPKSLRNIWKEIDNDINLGQDYDHCYELSGWAEQGVLLINTHLTTKAWQAGSHSKIGWEPITSKIIKKLSDEYNNIVFMLWGNQAQAKEKLINSDKHFILKAAHPSPLSAHKGFFGCSHFSLCNTFLMQNAQTVIDWNR